MLPFLLGKVVKAEFETVGNLKLVNQLPTSLSSFSKLVNA